MKSRFFDFLGKVVAALDPYAGKVVIFLTVVGVFVAPTAILHRRILLLLVAVSLSAAAYGITHIATALIKIANALLSQEGRSKADAA